MKRTIKQVYFFMLAGTLCVGNVYAEKPQRGAVIHEMQPKSKLTGTVSDALGPIIGAAVAVKGTNTGSVTDSEGRFSLDVPVGTTITISFIGYVTQNIKYTGQTTLNITLVEDSQKIDEVVVTAMGIKKEKRALSYAMSELKSDDLVVVPTQNIANSLYGKAAGVQIQQTAAGEMGGTKIQIRGINSIEGNTRPLVVVDGIPIKDNESDWGGRERSQTQPGSALNDINPDDIESMSILKGANAAALYGSRATNGVIVITTKRGSAKKGFGINLSTSYMYNVLSELPETQNIFGGGTSPEFTVNAQGQKIYTGATHNSFGPRMDGTEVLWWDGQVRPFLPQPDNYKSFFKNGFTNNNSVSVGNSSEKSNFRVSYTNMNYEGYLTNMKQTKNLFSLAGNFKVSDRLTVDASLSYNINDKQNSPTRIDRISNFPIPRNEIAQLWKDNYKNQDGYFLTPEISTIASSNRDNIINYLLWQQNENRYTENRERLIASMSANMEIFSFLNFKVRGGTDRYSDLNESKERFKKYADPADMTNLQGSYTKIENRYTKNYLDGLLMFNKQFGKDFDVNFTAGASVEDITESGLTWSSEGLKYDGMFSTANNKKDPKSANRDSGYNRGEFLGAVFATGQLAYKRYLYLDLTARNDWSSRLTRDNRSFFYPSAGLGFVFSDALKVPTWLNYGKLRASYAIVGNTAPQQFFTNPSFSYGSFNGSAIINSFGSSVPPALSIEPEKTYSWEFGLEAHTLNGRLGIDLAYYTNKTKNQILTIPMSSSTGATGLRCNAGEIANQGVEIQLNLVPVKSKKFNWKSTVNFSYTRNELVSLIDGMSDRQIANPWNVLFKAIPGSATPTIFTKKWARHENGSMIVDANGKYVQESEYSNFGGAAPDFIGGFSNTFTYGNLALDVHIDGSFGGQIVSFSNNYLKSSGSGIESLFGRDEEYGGLPYYIDKNTNTKVRLDSHGAIAPAAAKDGIVHHDGVIAEGVKADGTPNNVMLSAADYYNMRYNLTSTEDNIFDNSFVKLREIKLSYRVPQNVCSKIGLQNLNLSLVGSNLFYLYKSLPNLDPEQTLGTSGYSAYFEYTSYPSQRSYGFSINTSF